MDVSTLPESTESALGKPRRSMFFDYLSFAAEEAVRTKMDVRVACRWLEVMMGSLNRLQEGRDAEV